jgi:hypothetical protein
VLHRDRIGRSAFWPLIAFLSKKPSTGTMQGRRQLVRANATEAWREAIANLPDGFPPPRPFAFFSIPTPRILGKTRMSLPTCLFATAGAALRVCRLT